MSRTLAPVVAYVLTQVAHALGVDLGPHDVNVAADVLVTLGAGAVAHYRHQRKSQKPST